MGGRCCMQRLSILISRFLICMCLQSPCLHRLPGHTGLLPPITELLSNCRATWFCTVGGGGQSSRFPRDNAVSRYCLDLALMGQGLEKLQLLPVLTHLTPCPILTTAGFPFADYVSHWKAPKWPLLLLKGSEGQWAEAM